MVVYFSHATSFCGLVWRPVFESIETEVAAFDHPGHGQGPAVELPIDWKSFGEHVLAVTEPGGVGVGHSMGAAALAMAQAADPSRFKALILVEPIVFPPPFGRWPTPMAEVALKRKASFSSREEARANFLEKEAFAEWHPDALDGYLEGGWLGEGPVEIACAAEVEADVYRGSTAHATWELLPSIEVPVLLMYGESSDTIDEPFARAQAAQFRRAGVEFVPDSGHFLPMERPDIIAERVNRFLSVL